MSRESGEMEGKSTALRSTSSPSQNSIETPRGKGYQRNRNKWGNNGRSTNQGSPRPFRNDRREGCNTQYRGAVADKRPPPRAAYQSSRKEDVRLESGPDTPVYGAASGSKKYGNSLTHLLNFKYAPREKHPSAYHHKASSKKHSYFNKEQFIQANCQFVVGDAGDYSVCAMDPDVLVDWSLVEQVCIYSHEVPSCPICLFPPVAAKITRCGHIYCWSCILHYLSLSEKTWHKCPICYESVYQKDLKSVVAMETHHFAVGESVTMRLMKREKNSVLAVPKAQWQEREWKPFSISDEVDTRYAKLLLATTEEVLQKVVIPEECALTTQLMEAQSEQSGEQAFIEEALQEIKARHDSLNKAKDSAKEVASLLEAASLGTKNKDENADREYTSCRWKMQSATAIEGVDDYEAAFSDDEVAENDTEKTSDMKLHAPTHSSNGVTAATKCQDKDAEGDTKDQENTSPLSPKPFVQDTKHYYFYQADDGQNIFLHPVNARCLIMEYGSLENCPDTITGRIVEMEVMSQTEDTRKRYHYLGHLPLTCEFVIAEVDLKPPIVSRGTLEYFRENIQQRKQRRQKKMKMEKKREKKLSGNAATANGRFNSRSTAEDLNLFSEVDFPSQVGHMAMSPPAFSSPSPFMQFAEANISHDEEYSAEPGADEGTGSGGGKDTLVSSPPSFAQALRRGTALEPCKHAKKPSQCADAVRSGAPADENADPEDYVPVPTFQSAFSEALVTSDWNLPRSEDSLPKKEGKKKKGKKKLLFTTSSFMKYN